MKRLPATDVRRQLGSNYRPRLNVIEYVATKKGDPERGPLVRMRASEAKIRLIEDGTLVWVSGPRRQELAELRIDDSIPEGHVFLRDIAGVAVTEYVTVTRPDTDSPLSGRHFG
jgi:anaerobic selenocysteine-containing dehydrogenase